MFPIKLSQQCWKIDILEITLTPIVTLTLQSIDCVSHIFRRYLATGCRQSVKSYSIQTVLVTYHTVRKPISISQQSGIHQSGNGFSLNCMTEFLRKTGNDNNMFCFYPERAPQKAISKPTARIALANRRQGQSYTFESSTTLFVPCACFYICFQTF